AWRCALRTRAGERRGGGCVLRAVSAGSGAFCERSARGGCALRAVGTGGRVRSAVARRRSRTSAPAHAQLGRCPDDRSAGVSRADARKLLIRTVQSNTLPRLSCVLLLSLACSASPPPAGSSDSMADAGSGAEASDSSDDGDE